MREGVNNRKSKGARVNINELNERDHACYVLITCGPPTPDGKMSVEMTYEGDPTLAAYLLESAQGFIDHDEDAFSN